jgi:hypothetical protein
VAFLSPSRNIQGQCIKSRVKWRKLRSVNYTAANLERPDSCRLVIRTNEPGVLYNSKNLTISYGIHEIYK